VNGSADSSLLGKKVKCPKCIGIFTVSPEVLQPILLEDVELEQVDDPVVSLDVPTEKEVDDVFSKLLGEETDTARSMDEEREALDIVAAQLDEEDDAVVAALSDAEQAPESYNQWLGEEDEDETLTVIEDFPGESVDREELTLLGNSDDADLFEEKTVSEEPAETIALESKEDQWPVNTEEHEDESEEQILAFADELENELEDAFGDDVQEVEEKNVAEENLSDGEETSLDETHDEDDLVDDGDYELHESEEGEEIDEGVVVQKCSACGEYVDHEAKYEYDSHVYCEKCVPTELKKKKEEELSQTVSAFAAASSGTLAAGSAIAEEDQEAVAEAVPGRFTIATLIKDAYYYSKGTKGAIWGGIIVMYLVLIALGAATFFLFPQLTSQVDSFQAILLESGVQTVSSFLFFVFMAGILLIAVNKIGQQPFSWKMVFSGFSRFGSLLLLFVLQSIMLLIGFVLFILPGIYLSVGYALAIPLLFVKGLSPWQALEESRKAIHKRWWTVFFAMIAMSVLMGLSAIPLGIGLIWTVPMCVVLIAVLYYHFFGAEED
jgi:hypothetical protein